MRPAAWLLACVLSLAPAAHAEIAATEVVAVEAEAAARPADAPEPPDEVVATDERPFHCDGTDPAFFQEIQEAGWVGYGETWDFDTCGQGREVFVGQPNTRWKAWRLQRGTTTRSDEQASFYATLFPFVAFSMLGSVFGIAWILAVVQRRRTMPKVIVSCPSCDVEMPVPLDDPAFRSMFCPSCGGACVVIDQGSDGRARARVRAL